MSKKVCSSCGGGFDNSSFWCNGEVCHGCGNGTKSTDVTIDAKSVVLNNKTMSKDKTFEERFDEIDNGELAFPEDIKSFFKAEIAAAINRVIVDAKNNSEDLVVSEGSTIEELKKHRTESFVTISNLEEIKKKILKEYE